MDANPNPIFVPGIDISHHNGCLNWAAIVKAGVAFAYAKATEGASCSDPLFGANWRGIRDAGILRGAYHFLHPGSPPEQQADFFLNTVGGLKAGDLPPVLDIEETRPVDEWGKIAAAERVPLILRWLLRVEDQTGIRPVIYTRRGWVADELPAPGSLSQYPLWVAAYTNAPKPPLPKGWQTWAFWQYTESGSLPGVQGVFDMDRFNGSSGDLASLCVPANAIETKAIGVVPEVRVLS